MSAPESLRDEVTAALAGQAVRVQVVSVGTAVGFLRAESALHLADALLASPALARVIREAKAEAWDKGREATYSTRADNPYREGGA